MVPPVYPPAPNTAIDFLSRGVAADPRGLLDAAMERATLLWAAFFEEQPPKGESAGENA